MKKRGLIFILFCMACCLIPFAGMAVRPTNETTENRAMSSFPKIREDDGSVNREFFDDFDAYFNEHFAFRNELVYADARIQGDIFGVSAVDSVIRGGDDWLYYRSTLKDYLGTAPLSDRELYCLCRNLDIARRYTEERGSRFLFTVPPNKNTLYGEHMPYYDSVVAVREHNIDRLQPLLAQAEIPYADLVDAFRGEDETLYLKRDSHWNNKGAILAYNCILDALGVRHDRYENLAASRTKSEDGDLNRMLYTFYGEKELNYNYGIAEEFTYTTDTAGVEDAWIETACSSAGDSLLMFRDSFGNTLLPLMANQFGTACFTKEGQYRLEKLMDENDPGVVIFEKVERNLGDFLTSPPILTAPETETGPASVKESETTVEAAPFAFDIEYCTISGSIDEELVKEDTDIFVQINGRTYEAYLTGADSYTAYFRKDALPDDDLLEVHVLVRDGGNIFDVKQQNIGKGDLGA